VVLNSRCYLYLFLFFVVRLHFSYIIQLISASKNKIPSNT